MPSTVRLRSYGPGSAVARAPGRRPRPPHQVARLSRQLASAIRTLDATPSRSWPALRAELEHQRTENAIKERQLDRYAADLRATSRRERQRARELAESYMATVRALAGAVEARDAYTAHHADRVTAYGIELAAASGLELPRRGRARVRVPAARHRQGRDPRRDPLQGRHARPPRARGDAAPPGDRRGDHQRDRLPRAGAGAGPPPPRALGRRRLPRRAGRRGDPARGPRVRARRRARRAHQRPPLPRRGRDRAGARGDRAQRGAVRPGRARGLRLDLRRAHRGDPPPAD